MKLTIPTLLLLPALVCEYALAQPSSVSPAAIPDLERAAFFGDLHLHTGLSFDAAASGIQTTPDDAYRFALGEPVQYMGRTVQRNRPLDFLAVTDHAEYLGIAPEAANPDGQFANTGWPARIAEVFDNTLGYMSIFSASGFRGAAPVIEEFATDTLITSNWQREMSAAERYYRPEEFTTFIAYEWSPMPGGAHLHRNVIFRGPQYPERPFSSLDSQRPEDLWSFVEELRSRDIDSVLIPHNSNMSQGMMFASSDSYGEPISQDYARRRLSNERLVEIAQNKGSSETRPEFGEPDEFANFELISLAAERDADPSGGYIRPALGRGLEIEAQIAINPFRFGLIGSSDFHSGLSSTEEDNFPGALGRSDDMSDPEKVLNEINPVANAPSTIFSAGAITGLWAERNTRESLFAALKRREAFATSGTRIQIRLFAGWDFEDDILDNTEWVKLAYETGYPMGADLPAREVQDGEPLKLVVHAVKDSQGANLDRIQIIKIWRENQELKEKIINVVWAGERQVENESGRLPLVGNSVDLETARYTNDIGATQLSAVWSDAEFDAEIPTIYYARVLEIPTPRWSTYLAVRNNLPISEAVPATIQERAWTSPVFYSP